MLRWIIILYFLKLKWCILKTANIHIHIRLHLCLLKVFSWVRFALFFFCLGIRFICKIYESCWEVSFCSLKKFVHNWNYLFLECLIAFSYKTVWDWYFIIGRFLDYWLHFFSCRESSRFFISSLACTDIPF